MKNDRLEARRSKISRETSNKVNKIFDMLDSICCGTCKWMNDGECDNNKDCINFNSHEFIK